jgi:hypothetical protein
VRGLVLIEQAPARSFPFIQNRFCAVIPLSSLPPLPCPPEGAQVDFELLTAIEVIEAVGVTRIEVYIGAGAQSPIALNISSGSVGSVGRVAARGRAAKSTAAPQGGPIRAPHVQSQGRPCRWLDEPFSPLVLSHFQLASGSRARGTA